MSAVLPRLLDKAGIAAYAVGFDPLKNKAYAATRLGRSVADFLAWMQIGGAVA